MSKDTTLPSLPAKLGGSKKRWLLNNIKSTWENTIAKNGESTPISYYFMVCLGSLPNQLLDKQYHFTGCMRRLSGDGCVVKLYTYGYCLLPRKGTK